MRHDALTRDHQSVFSVETNSQYNEGADGTSWADVEEGKSSSADWQCGEVSPEIALSVYLTTHENKSMCGWPLWPRKNDLDRRKNM